MFKLNDPPRLLPPDIVREARKYSTCQISDAMSGFCVMDYRIKPVARGMKLAGTAWTVEASPGSYLMSHLAFALCREGYVLVLTSQGDTARAVVGDLMVRAGVKKGIEGAVVDGLVRDIDELRQLGWPLFARGSTPAAAGQEGSGEMNGLVTCGGIAVHPGDLIVADDDGVVVVHTRDIEPVLQAAKTRADNEARRIQEIGSGNLVPQWLESRMAELGYPGK